MYSFEYVNNAISNKSSKIGGVMLTFTLLIGHYVNDSNSIFVEPDHSDFRQVTLKITISNQ